MSKRIITAFVEHPYVVVLLALLVGFFALQEVVDLENRTLKISVDSSIESLLPAGGPELETYAAVRDQFVGDDLLIIVWQADDLFTPEGLAALKRLTRRLEKTEGVVRVDSLASATFVRAEDDFTNVDEFLAELPTTLSEAQGLRAEAIVHPLYAGQLVSRDGRATMLAVHFDPDLSSSEVQAAVDAVAAASKAEAGDIEQYLTGPVFARLATGLTLFTDIQAVFPLAVAATFVVSVVGLRSLPGMVLPLLANAIALLVTIAVFIRTGHKLNFVTIIMPPVVFVVGFAYAVHVVSDFERELAKGLDKIAALKRSLEDVFVPLTLTAFTTGVGFLSLTTSNIKTIQVFGAFSAFGTGLSWLCAVTLVPAGLRFLPSSAQRKVDQGVLLKLAPRISKFDLENRKFILFAGFLLALFSLAFASKIDVGTDYLRNFPEDSEIRRNFNEIGQSFSGAVPLQILIESDIPNVFKNPAELHILDDLQAWVKQQPEVRGAVSFVDYMRMLHRTFVPELKPEHAIPKSFNLSDQLLALGASEDAEQFIDSRYKTTLMHVRSTAVSSNELGDLVARIEERLNQLPTHLRGQVTGSSVLIALTMDDITRGQILSLSGALFVIYVILSTLFGSLRVGAIALVPNLLPIVAFFGLLGLTGITLNLATSLVATVALGIAVDDSIHYFSRFNNESRRLANEEQGVEHAIAGIIRPVTFTTAALCAGFLALLVSDLRNQVEFGVLAAATLFLAWAVDLTISPALSSGLRFVTLWEVLLIDLGDEPHKKIPLFNGLTHRQARIAALFGRIEAYKPGERIIKQGEEGHEICILIEGTVAAKVTRDDGDALLREMHPGEVFGEVALFTGQRTAHIDAVDDVRLLWMNQESLERIRIRYPKIAAHIFWNLTGTVAERRADVTARL